MADINRDEFENWMQVLREDIHGVHERLDKLNGRTRTMENAVAVLQDRGADGRKQGAISGGIVAGAAALVEIARHLLSK